MRRSALAAVTVLLLAACTTSGTDDAAVATPGPMAPTGDVVTIEPLDALDGAEVVELAGVELLVPSDYTQERVTVSETAVGLVLTPPGAARHTVTVTVTEEPGATNDAVDQAARVFSAEAGLTGITGLQASPGAWPAVPYSVVTTLALTLDDGAVRDVITVNTRNESGTSLITVWAEAEPGELEDSEAYAILRTLTLTD